MWFGSTFDSDDLDRVRREYDALAARQAALPARPAAPLLAAGGRRPADRREARAGGRGGELRRRRARDTGDSGPERDHPADRRRRADPVHGAGRVRRDPAPRRGDARSGLGDRPQRDPGRQLLVGARRRAGRFGRRRDPGHRLRDERRRHVHPARHPAPRQAHGRRQADGRARPDLPGDRRSGTPRAPAGDARRQRPEHGVVAGRGHAPPARVGDRSVLADRRQPGRDPARQERRHPGVPLGGQADRQGDRLLRPGRLRGDRAVLLDRHRAARRTAGRAAETCSPGTRTR